MKKIIELPCDVGEEFYTIAYSQNQNIIKVFCDGYEILRNYSSEKERKSLWMQSADKETDCWKVNVTDFEKEMFKTEEEAFKKFNYSESLPKKIIELPCDVGEEFYAIAYSGKNRRVIKVSCNGYGILKNYFSEEEQKFLWFKSIEKETDFWKVDASDFEEKIFKTEKEAFEKLNLSA